MAVKPVIEPLGSLQNESSAVSTINANTQRIIDAFTALLSKSEPGEATMNQTLDMNSQRIINLPSSINSSEPATRGQLEEAINNLKLLYPNPAVRKADIYSAALGNLAEGQTVFVVPDGYVIGFCDVVFDGYTLEPDRFVATDGTTVTILDPVVEASDVIVIVSQRIAHTIFH